MSGKRVITDFSEFRENAGFRVELIDIDLGNGEEFSVYIREMSGETAGELMRRAPNIMKVEGGETILNDTNRLDIAFIVAKAVVTDESGKTLMRESPKSWSLYPSRILLQIATKVIELSNFDDTVESDEEKKDSS